MAEAICPPKGRHCMLYLNTHRTEKDSIALCYNSCDVFRRSKLPQLHCLPLVLVGQIHCTVHCITEPKSILKNISPLQIWAFCKSFVVSVTITTAGGDEEPKGRNLRSKSSSPDSGRPCKDAHNQGRSLFVFVENQIILRVL